MNDLVTWADIDAELGKGEQMGYQTVLQFAKVGQMLKAKMGDMPIREFVPHVGQHIPRLSKSSIHRYLTLADNLPLLEQKQPDSQRAALAMIADAKRPPPRQMPDPAPMKMPAPKPDPAPMKMPAPKPDPAPKGGKYYVGRVIRERLPYMATDEMKEMEKLARVGGAIIDDMIENNVSLDDLIRESLNDEDVTASNFTENDMRLCFELAVKCPLSANGNWLMENLFEDDFDEQVERMRHHPPA